MPGCLFVVATPIGNLQDITYRAVEIFKKCEVVVAEDTRETRRLLSHLNIHARLLSCHEHKELDAADQVLSLLHQGMNAALVTDAGTPAISDPGARFVAYMREKEIQIVPVPGPSSIVTALSVSGMFANRFYFGGFLPAKHNERLQFLQNIQALPDTLVFLEAPHRLLASLNDIYSALGDRSVFLAKELTKLHETLIFTRLSLVQERLKEISIRGEWVIGVEGAVHGHEERTEMGKQAALRLIEHIQKEAPLSMKDLSKVLAEITGLSRSWVYEQLLKGNGVIANPNEAKQSSYGYDADT